MRTKLLFLSLALMTLGGTSEVKAQTTLGDLTATSTESTYIHGAYEANISDYWVLSPESNRGLASKSSDSYLIWFYSNSTFTAQPTATTLPVGTYILKTNVPRVDGGTFKLKVTQGESTLAAEQDIASVGTHYTLFYNADASTNVNIIYTVAPGSSNTNHLGNVTLYKIDQAGDHTALFSEATNATYERVINRVYKHLKAETTTFDGAKKADTSDYSTIWTTTGTAAASGKWNYSTNYVAWFWTESDPVTLSQTMESQPAGTYFLKSYINKKQSNTSFSVTVKRGEVEIASHTYSNSDSEYTVYIPFYNSESGNLTVTYTFDYTGSGKGATVNWGNDYLYRVTKDEVDGNYMVYLNSATAEQYESVIAGMSVEEQNLRNALAAAQEYYDWAPKGTGLFQFSGGDAFNTVLGATNTMLEEENEEEYETQTTAVNNALATFKGTHVTPDPARYYYIKYDSKYINICEYTTTSWNPNRTLALLTSLPYAVQFEAYSADYNQYYIKANGKYLGQYSGYTWAPAVLDSPSGYFTAAPDASGVKFANSWGSYQLATGTADNVYTYLSLNNNNTVRSFTVEEAATTNVSMFISSAEWGTFVAPFAVNLTGDLAGVEAYTITTDGTTITKSEALSTIPANTPVLLHKTGGLSATNVSGYAQSYYTGLPEEGNLVGFLATGGSIPASVAEGDTYYVLQNNTSGLGWYKVTSELTGTANRAYLKVPAGGAAARQFIPLFDDSETTGITQVNGENVKANDYYNLKGQRVSQPTKGLYIVGGKKVMVK